MTLLYLGTYNAQGIRCLRPCRMFDIRRSWVCEDVGKAGFPLWSEVDGQW